MRNINISMTDNNMRKINIKKRSYYYLNELIDIRDLDFENIILKKVLHKSLFIYHIRQKITCKLKAVSINFIK